MSRSSKTQTGKKRNEREPTALAAGAQAPAELGGTTFFQLQIKGYTRDRGVQDTK